jgi:hypothetical protein
MIYFHQISFSKHFYSNFRPLKVMRQSAARLQSSAVYGTFFCMSAAFAGQEKASRQLGQLVAPG